MIGNVPLTVYLLIRVHQSEVLARFATRAEAERARARFAHLLGWDDLTIEDAHDRPEIHGDDPESTARTPQPQDLAAD